MMLSPHLYLGLPLGLVVKGFHLNIFLVALASGILCICNRYLYFRVIQNDFLARHYRLKTISAQHFSTLILKFLY